MIGSNVDKPGIRELTLHSRLRVLVRERDLIKVNRQSLEQARHQGEHIARLVESHRPLDEDDSEPLLSGPLVVGREGGREEDRAQLRLLHCPILIG